jgi:hypothetical protein
VGELAPTGSLPGALPGEADGAAVLAGRLYFTMQASAGVQQLWSLDLASGARRLEATVHVVGESEGLAAYRGLGGTLHWVIAPGVGGHATYGHQSVLLHLSPRGAPLTGPRQRLSRLRLSVTPSRRPVRAGHSVTLALRGTARVVGALQPADGAVVRVAGRRVTLDPSGTGSIRVRVPRKAHRLRVHASRRGLRPTVVTVPVRRR